MSKRVLARDGGKFNFGLSSHFSPQLNAIKEKQIENFPLFVLVTFSIFCDFYGQNPFFSISHGIRQCFSRNFVLKTLNKKYVVFVTSEKRLSSRSNKCRGAIYFGVKIRT